VAEAAVDRVSAVFWALIDEQRASAAPSGGTWTTTPARTRTPFPTQRTRQYLPCRYDEAKEWENARQTANQP
jgi:hypothetical protein